MVLSCSILLRVSSSLSLCVSVQLTTENSELEKQIVAVKETQQELIAEVCVVLLDVKYATVFCLIFEFTVFICSWFCSHVHLGWQKLSCRHRAHRARFFGHLPRTAPEDHRIIAAAL